MNRLPAADQLHRIIQKRKRHSDDASGFLTDIYSSQSVNSSMDR